nr:hypothetical protein [Marichromatium purpuratum]
MKQSLYQERYPVYCLEIGREETSYDSVEAICDYFRACIERYDSARFIAEFDHHAHTSALPEGHVGEGILAAKNLIFCFGISLPDVQVLALRPRSIGIAETESGFVITFMEAPMPVVNAAMEDWACGLCDRHPLPTTSNRSRAMRIAVTSQNFRTITGHAGKTRRFLILEAGAEGATEIERLDLPAGMSLHDYHGDDHPLFMLGLDALLTQGAGQGFVQRMSRQGVVVHTTSATDPFEAATMLAAGKLLPAARPHEH